MALPLLTSLTQVERLAWSAIRGGVYQGVSATAGLAAYRRAGGAIRTQSWFRVWRATSDLVAHGRQLRNLARSARPAESRLPYAVGTQLRKYSYLFEVRGLAARQTGAQAYYATYSSSVLVTRGEAERALLSRMGLVSPKGEGEIESFVLLGVTRQVPEASGA